jgi:PAS domain S-box-containing protein
VRDILTHGTIVGPGDLQMTHEEREQEDLVNELVDLCGKIAELGATLLISKGVRKDPTEDQPDNRGAQVYDFPRWAERAARLKSLQVEDISSLAAKDVSRLIRDLRAHQVEATMQNEELKRTHQELKQAKDKYSDLYDFAPVGYFTLDRAGLILDVNRTGAALLGRARNRLVKKPFSSFLSADDYRTYYSHLKQVFGTKTRRTCEIQLERHDQRRFPARLESVAVPDSNGEFNQCRMVVSNIKDLKIAQKALQESEELHRITLTNISDTVLITDDGGMFTYICPNVHVIFGYDKDEVQALRNIENLLGANFFDPSVLDQVAEIENIERRIEDKSGQEHVLLVNVKRVSIKGGTLLYSCRDVTALKRAQEALENSKLPMV